MQEIVEKYLSLILATLNDDLGEDPRVTRRVCEKIDPKSSPTKLKLNLHRGKVAQKFGQLLHLSKNYPKQTIPQWAKFRPNGSP
jgi:hypothetical protein